MKITAVRLIELSHLSSMVRVHRREYYCLDTDDLSILPVPLSDCKLISCKTTLALAAHGSQILCSNTIDRRFVKSAPGGRLTLRGISVNVLPRMLIQHSLSTLLQILPD